MPLASDFSKRLKGLPRWLAGAAGLAIVTGVVLLLRGGGSAAGVVATFTVRQGPLSISVLEGGSIQALESQEVKCEARVGYQGVKILKIVEEGYLVTEEDLRTNKVLVELDSSELEKQRVQQEIQFQSAAASLTDAQQGYEIQFNQNLSDIKAAQQKERFALMDFEKYLGAQTAKEIIEKLGIREELLAEQTNATVNALSTNAPGPEPPEAAPGAAAIPPVAVPPTAAAAPVRRDYAAVDFSRYADLNLLGDGEAKQKLRELLDTLQVGQKEQGQAKSTLEATKRLHEKGFVTKVDLERDEIAAENARLKVQKAETARDLFLQYEFKKSAEESLSKYVEAARELNRARKAAVSKLAQAEAKFRSAQAQFNVQQRQLKEMTEQVDKCVLRAKKAGLVVYGGGGGDDMVFYGDQERIREGATVRERQSIITIPDMTKMGVKVRIHESYIKQVKKGQKVRITADAVPDQVLDGEVTKVGVLPDSANSWLSPGMKVYLTTISITGAKEWLKPGMTAKVEILVDTLPNVTYVPVQAVTPLDGGQVCHVRQGRKTEPRKVEIGQFNDEFIEIKSGLREGEVVLLRPPDTGTRAEGEKPKSAGKEAPKPTVTAPAGGTAKPG